MRGHWQWFSPQEVAPGVFRLDDAGYVNSYLVLGSRQAALIDTGLGIADMRRVVREITPLPVTVINTHAHWDHVMGNHLFSRIMIAAAEGRWLAGPYPQDRLRRLLRNQRFTRPFPAGFSPRAYRFISSRPSVLVAGGETLDLGGRRLRIVPAPGHTAGSLIVSDDEARIAWVGDAAGTGMLYAQSPGGSDLWAWAETLDRLAAREPVLVLPGHGPPVDAAFVRQQAVEMRGLADGERTAWRRPDGLWQADLEGFAVLLPADYQSTRGRH